MKQQKRMRDYGICIGRLETGRRNSITDVPGVLVGHFTISDKDINTGVTSILPHTGNCQTAAGLSRTGTHFGNGSGDIVIGFTTANKIKHYEDSRVIDEIVESANK